jgi:hypothetical protein
MTNCSPKGELPAKPGEGVNGGSGNPLRPAFAVHLPLMGRN